VDAIASSIQFRMEDLLTTICALMQSHWP